MNLDVIQDYLNKNLKVVLPVGIVMVVVVILAGFFLYQNFKVRPQTTAPAGSPEEVRQLVSEVGKLIELPIGEDPTVATVTDIEKLKDQPFFKNAQNGDKVLIYQNAQKAILYRSSTKKILEVAPINTGTTSAQPVSESTPTLIPQPSPESTPTPSPLPTLAPASE